MEEIISRVDYNCYGETTLFNVIRGRVVDGAFRAMKRSSFYPEKPVSVKFMDDIGTSEGAVDEGGPRREFFTLAMKELHDSPMFDGAPGQKFIVPSQSGMWRTSFIVAVLLLICSPCNGAPLCV